MACPKRVVILLFLLPAGMGILDSKITYDVLGSGDSRVASCLSFRRREDSSILFRGLSLRGFKLAPRECSDGRMAAWTAMTHHYDLLGPLGPCGAVSDVVPVLCGSF